MITNPEALIITEVSQQAFIEMFKQYIRDVLGLKNPDSDSTKTSDFTKFPHNFFEFMTKFLAHKQRGRSFDLPFSFPHNSGKTPYFLRKKRQKIYAGKDVFIK